MCTYVTTIIRALPPNMEREGAIQIFNRSLDKHNLYYTGYYGDGDSKSFSAVQNIYGAAKHVTKFECNGHYQKRVGTRLRNLKKEVKGLKGRGRLTDSRIDELQNYFGIALRQSDGGTLDDLVKGCKAAMYHVSRYLPEG